MAVLRCRHLALIETLALLDRDLDAGDGLDPCQKVATFSTFVLRRREGQDVEIYTLTCGEHDAAAHAAQGYVRSNRLRQPGTS